MTNIATHVRIFDPSPSDDLVTKRTKAVTTLSSGFGRKQSVLSTLQSANDLARATEVGGELSGTLASQIEKAVQQSAKAFIAKGQELEMTVCGLLAALHLLDRTPLGTANVVNRDVMAIGLWSALSFQTPHSGRLETLRSELLNKAQEFVLRKAMSSRHRLEVPDAELTPPAEYDPTKFRKALQTGLNSTIEALRKNAILDREEIDFLWWVLTDWSELLCQRFSNSNNPEATAVASGLEAGRLLRSLPVDAHYRLVLRHIGEIEPLSLVELLRALGIDRERLAETLKGNSVVGKFPVIFPLLTALQSGSATGANAEISRSLQDWAGRAFLESAAAQVVT